VSDLSRARGHPGWAEHRSLSGLRDGRASPGGAMILVQLVSYAMLAVVMGAALAKVLRRRF
jgi:hypothetical protein